jgi:hypothetical protein
VPGVRELGPVVAADGARTHDGKSHELITPMALRNSASAIRVHKSIGKQVSARSPGSPDNPSRGRQDDDVIRDQSGDLLGPFACAAAGLMIARGSAHRDSAGLLDPEPGVVRAAVSRA